MMPRICKFCELLEKISYWRKLCSFSNNKDYNTATETKCWVFLVGNVDFWYFWENAAVASWIFNVDWEINLGKRVNYNVYESGAYVAQIKQRF